MYIIALYPLGRKNLKFYRLVCRLKRTKVSGKVVAFLGSWDPYKKELLVKDKNKLFSFLLNGVKPTLTVISILKKSGVWNKFKIFQKQQELAAVKTTIK